MSHAALGFRRRGRDVSVVGSWQRQSWPLRILRAFLGMTFLYAGAQKLADANFLHAGTADYIGSQLQAFARGSPLHGLLTLADKVPVLTGVLVALAEIGVGLGSLLGIAPLAWASIGFAISVTLWLSATWHVHPYFLGSDSMYAVAWLSYGVGELELERREARAFVTHGSRRSRASQSAAMGRREFLRAALLATGAVVLGGASAAVGEMSKANLSTSPGLAQPTTLKARHQHTPKPFAVTPKGTKVATLSEVPVGQAIAFSDPGQGPAVMVRLAENRVAAYSRVCTHAGCLVGYDPGQRLLVCPCHGAEFDPGRGGEPVAGPAFSPLHRIDVAIDHSTGEVIARR